MKFPKSVKIVEVGPRDGLQNETIIISTDDKIKLINQLSDSGLSCIEATSFVSPKWIPPLADAEMVMSKINKKPGVTYPVLIPNLQGLERALQAGTTEIAVFCAATETFSQKNTHCSIAESLDKIAAIVLKAKTLSMPIRAYISCALGCPYEGDVKPTTVLTMAKHLMRLGCDEIALGDTIGIGTPLQAQNLIKMIATEIPIDQLAIHFHDTYGQALANIYACLEVGIRTIDSAIGGLGGCPYAAGASGNVATEDVLYMLQGLGIATGVNLDAIIATSQFINQLTHHSPQSKVTQAKIGKTNSRIS